MALKKITTPKGSIINSGNGKAELTWNQNFAAKRNAQFSRKQMIEPFGGTEKVQSEGSVPDWYVGKIRQTGNGCRQWRGRLHCPVCCHAVLRNSRHQTV